MEQWYGPKDFETSAAPLPRDLVCGALLAGGRSSRFQGADKQEAIFEGETLGRKAAANLLGAGIDVLVVGSNRAPYSGLELRFVRDLLPGFGPLSGLHAALAACERPWLYLLACDMPRSSPIWLAHLVSRVGGPGIGGAVSTPLAAAASFGPHIEPFHALYSKACIPLLEAYAAEAGKGDTRPSIQGFLRSIGALLVPESEYAGLGLDRGLFLNINKPNQLIL